MGRTLMYIENKDDISLSENEGSNSFEELRVNALGASIDFSRSLTNKSDLFATCCSADMETTTETIHNHLCSLLGHHIKCRLMKTPTGKTPFFPKLGNIEMLEIYGDGFDATRIDDFLSRSTCLESISWMSHFDKEIELIENSKIYELDTVYLWTSRSMATDCMKHFNGRRAFLGEVTTPDVIQFLNTWRSGKKFQNLEVISMMFYFKVPVIRRSVEFRELSSEVEYVLTEKDHKLMPRVSLHSSWECKSHLYMVRESDNRVASVMLKEGNVSLAVWSMTEEEFLAKFEEPKR